jgi:hypothetical protein
VHAELIARLDSADRAEQRAAGSEIARRLKAEPELRGALYERLRAGAPLGRFAAAWSLAQVERPNLRMLPALLAALELADGDVRWSAVQLLVDLGRVQSEVLPVLVHEAGRAEPLRRRMALYALRELAPEAPETQARVLEALEAPEAELRRAALSSVAKLVDPSPACLERVLDALERDPDPRMRRIAAVVVPDLGARFPELADRARGALEAAARADDVVLARSARAGLARTGVRENQE